MRAVPRPARTPTVPDPHSPRWDSLAGHHASIGQAEFQVDSLSTGNGHCHGAAAGPHRGCVYETRTLPGRDDSPNTPGILTATGQLDLHPRGARGAVVQQLASLRPEEEQVRVAITVGVEDQHVSEAILLLAKHQVRCIAEGPIALVEIDAGARRIQVRTLLVGDHEIWVAVPFQVGQGDGSARPGQVHASQPRHGHIHEPQVAVVAVQTQVGVVDDDQVEVPVRVEIPELCRDRWGETCCDARFAGHIMQFPVRPRVQLVAAAKVRKQQDLLSGPIVQVGSHGRFREPQVPTTPPMVTVGLHGEPAVAVVEVGHVQRPVFTRSEVPRKVHVQIAVTVQVGVRLPAPVTVNSGIRRPALHLRPGQVAPPAADPAAVDRPFALGPLIRPPHPREYELPAAIPVQVHGRHTFCVARAAA